MNVELVHPMSVLGLFARSDAAMRQSSRWLSPARARQVRARLDGKLRYRRALHELRQLEDRELDDLGLARADFRALGWRQAHDLPPLART